MADEPLIVTITISRGGVKLHRQMIPAEMRGAYDLSSDFGIVFGAGRVFRGYEFKPYITGEQRDPFIDLPESTEEPLA